MLLREREERITILDNLTTKAGEVEDGRGRS